MLLAPPRLEVRAWFTLAVAGPAAMLALAGAATSGGMTRAAELWLAVLLAPAVALALKGLETPRSGEAAQNDDLLTAAFCLSLGEACVVLLAVLAGAPVDGRAIACGLSVAAIPLGLAVGAHLLRLAFRPLLETAPVAQAFQQPDAGRRQGPVERAEDVLLKEVAGEVEARADIAGLQARLRREYEPGQGQQPVLVGLAGLAADGAPGARADIDQVVDGAGGGAFAEIEAEAQVLQQPGLEAHEDGRPDVGIGEGGREGLERQEGAGMWIPLRKRAGGDGGGGGDSGQGQGVVEQGGGPLPHRLQSRRAKLFGDPGAVSNRGAGADLEVRPDPPRGAAGHMGGVAAVAGGEQVHDRPGLAVGAGREHEGVVYEFHRIKLWVPAPEIQRELEEQAGKMDAALGELRGLLDVYRAQVVEPTPASATPIRRYRGAAAEACAPRQRDVA